MFLVDDALLLKNGTADVPVDEHLSYTIEMQAQIEQLSAGVCFSIADQQNYYMWQFNASDPQHPRLRPQQWLGGSASLLGEIDLPAEADIQTGHPFRIKLEIEDETYVKTYINDVLVDERSGRFTFGNIGFRQAHDDAYAKAETASYDNVRISVRTGERTRSVVFSEDFSASNPFSAGTIADGWLRVEGQMSHDVLAWLREVPDAVSLAPATSAKRESRYLLDGTPAPRHASGIIVRGGKKYLTKN